MCSRYDDRTEKQKKAELFREDNGKNTVAFYPNQEELIQDIAKAYQTVIADLYAAGCRNVQFDDEHSGEFEPLAHRRRFTKSSCCMQ